MSSAFEWPWQYAFPPFFTYDMCALSHTYTHMYVCMLHTLQAAAQ
jgi:hypothetical protein